MSEADGNEREVSADAFARSVTNMRALVAVLPLLEAAPCTVPDLVALAPELVCELGFDRGLVSRVENGVWHPVLMYIVGNPDWAQEIGSAGAEAPLKLEPGLHETTLVEERRPILVLDAQRHDAEHWGHPGMVAVSKTNSYVAAPIMSGEEVVGILTADRYASGREVDELDLKLLAAFAQVFQLALSRAALAENLNSAELLLAQLADALGTARAEVHRTPRVRIERTPEELPRGVVVRSRPRTAHPLPSSLTPRELEVLELMAGGRTNLAIAQQLFITDGTVKQHVKHILRKLGAANRSEAVMRWFQAGGADAALA
jgi:DNA-binding CsgD family transcriptional regulator